MTESQPFVVEASLITDTGCVRSMNQDCCQAVQPSGPDVLERKGVLVVVADGMGGVQGGEIASRVAVETVVRSYYASEADAQTALTAAFQEANTEIFRFAQIRKDLSGMGSTCSAVVIHGRLAYSAHVGDSRIYLIRSGSIYRMTEDHSAVTELVKQGAITPEAARRHAERNVILRALGTRPRVEVASWDRPLPVCAGDWFVLSSDGLHDLVTDDEIRGAAESETIFDACELLVAIARERGGHDNITVAIARVRDGG